MSKDKGPPKKGRRYFPTVRQLVSDRVGVVARENWAPTLEAFPPFNPKVVQNIYYQELQGHEKTSQIMFLEFSQYLENYLWPNFCAQTSSKEHVISIVMMVNEKWRERNPAWSVFVSSPAQFEGFFQAVLDYSLAENSIVTLVEKSVLLVFLMHCMNSIEVDIIRFEIQKLLSLASWENLLPGKLNEELDRNPKLKKLWKALVKSDKKLDEGALLKAKKGRDFMKRLLQQFVGLVSEMEREPEVNVEKRKYCERFLELLIDMEVILPTRRFFNTLLDNEQVVVRLEMSKLNGHPDCSLLCEMLQYLKYYASFEIDDHSGNPLTQKEMMSRHYRRVTELQRSVFKLYPELHKFCTSSVSRIDSREMLMKHFRPLNSKKLHHVCAMLNMVESLPQEGGKSSYDKRLLLEMITSRHEKRLTQLQKINNMPLYPTEELLWDENVIPMSFYDGKHCLALPKLNLQFLTLHDYLLRNFHLFRLEAAYEIREELEDVVSRLKPWHTRDTQEVNFGGWAKFGMPITNFTRFEVTQPRLGEAHPAKVSGHVTVTLSMRPELKEEWENLRRFDTGFLLTLRPSNDSVQNLDNEADFQTRFGVVYVRGIEFEGKLDDESKLIEDFPDQPVKFKGDQRTFRVLMDPCQYQIDMENHENGEEDVYETFNVIFRRSPKVNNFKAVLETIRDLMNSEFSVPEWLHDIILGYGDPASAHYSNMPHVLGHTTGGDEDGDGWLDFNDTFLDYEHLVHGFPNCRVQLRRQVSRDQMIPPFRLRFKQLSKETGEDDKETVEGTGTEDERKNTEMEMESVVEVDPHVIPNRGPFPFDAPKKNAIRFTPTQIEAIKSGMHPGLTMIVGPPGTGKTDVAVQIISNLYHNWPHQRTLIVTHSNMALNQLFEKIIALDIDERHCLRLGHGEESLETEKDFSRYGRVNFVLQQRLQLLAEVSRLQRSLLTLNPVDSSSQEATTGKSTGTNNSSAGHVEYTCETAAHFFLHQVVSRWEQYWGKVGGGTSKKGHVTSRDVIDLFPFHGFFSTAPQPLFTAESVEKDLDIAEGCWRHIKTIFTKLEEYRAFELLRTGSERSKYLLVKEAKIIAMTCTHAALKRRDLVQFGFQYDNVLMEEAGQILEIETFIPLMLQKEKDGRNRLKRWIMIGDHNQLPPTVKNMSFAKYSNMEQSLFTRLIKLNVPTVTLDAQGRARASLAQLYSWRYETLGNLPHVQLRPEFTRANAGFCFDYQAINVGELNGLGETEPAPHFFQNLAEAEFVVATYIYMRLIGYPAEKITILTQYNGQRMLLNDVVMKKCAQNPLIGAPHKVETVDKYQGQQNDYILLSLTRTRSVGHLRDVRRLVVAMSRARLGLYVFARVDLFRDCIELSPAFVRFVQRPLTLHLAPTEQFPTARPNSQFPTNPMKITDVTQMCHFVHNMYEQKRAFFEHQAMRQHHQQHSQQPDTMDITSPQVITEQSNTNETEYVASSQHDSGVAISFDGAQTSAEDADHPLVTFDSSSVGQVVAPHMQPPDQAMEEDLQMLETYDELRDSIQVRYNTDS